MWKTKALGFITTSDPIPLFVCVKCHRFCEEKNAKYIVFVFGRTTIRDYKWAKKRWNRKQKTPPKTNFPFNCHSFCPHLSTMGWALAPEIRKHLIAKSIHKNEIYLNSHSQAF